MYEDQRLVAVRRSCAGMWCFHLEGYLWYSQQLMRALAEVPWGSSPTALEEVREGQLLRQLLRVEVEVVASLFRDPQILELFLKVKGY